MRRNIRHLLGSAALMAAALLANPVLAQVQARSAQTVKVAGKTVKVQAEVGLEPVASKPGRQDATAGYISYTGPARADRPVLFIFNGGPGAASAYLHMGALGPMRAQVPQDPAATLPAEAPVSENPASLLDLADLVFVDPPGTGFSTIADDADRSVYQSVKGDADAVAQLAQAWLTAHGRTRAPLYILGESYGTIRAAAMVEALRLRDPALQVRGVLLLGQALNMIETSQRPDNVITYPISLPTLSAIACYHRKRPAPCDPAASAAEASAFGPAYLDALFRGAALDAGTRAEVAARLEDLTGIPRAYYLAHDLRISKEQFRTELLRTDGKVLGRYDARYTAPRPANAGEIVGPDAFSPVSDLYAKAVLGALKRIGVADPSPYKVITRFPGDWAYGSGDSPFNDWPFMAQLEKNMAENPKLRLFVGTGLFDLTTTVGAADYLFAQSSLPAERYFNARYPAGHVAYSDDASWQKLVSEIRAFLMAGATQ
ncbi:S10 family serine carboxypeptidase-like protein [Sphingomonas sp. CJ20]